jgi:protein ImuB
VYWLACHLPGLPLAVFLRPPDAGPFAVVTPERPPRVAVADRAAARAGVRPGMALSAAHVLAAELTTRERDGAAEARALERLAAWALGFTPTVSLQPPAGLLLEVAGSLGLFGGLEALMARVREGLAALGHGGAALGAAPTPTGAWLLARAGNGTPVPDMAALPARLDPLSLAVLDLAPDTAADLGRVGLATLGDLRALPRPGTLRRFGAAPLATLDRALGALPEPRAPFVPPPVFDARLPLPAETADREALLFGLRRLLAELEGTLGARNAGVDALTLHLAPEGAPAQAVPLRLTAPDRDRDRLLDLFRARLERHELERPVAELRLTAAPPVPLPARERPLFEGIETHTEGRAQLLERLRARLGEATVAGLCGVADHRPERAWRRCPPGQAAPLPVPGARPVWLLARPLPLRVVDDRPWLGGPLRLTAGPERIEAGWWDGADAARDYYRAEDAAGGRHWVFRRLDRGDWFRHGLFA